MKRHGHRSHVGDPNRFAAQVKDKLVEQTKELERRLKAEGGRNHMLKELKNFDADVLQMDELVSLSAYARGLENECQVLEMEVPEWLQDRRRTLNATIKSRRSDEIQRRLKEAKIGLDKLATPDEKKQKLRDEIARLEKLAGA